MEFLTEIVVALLIVTGGAFALIGSWGLARLSSLMCRLHGPTKATTLGVGSSLVASMVYFPLREGTWSFHELLIALFLFITAPISANMIAKAHMHRQHNGIDAKPMDAIDSLPGPGSHARWATFADPIPIEENLTDSAQHGESRDTQARNRRPPLA